MEALFFSVGGSLYLAPLVSLAEVLMPATLRRVPGAPAFLLGLLNLRGAALPVVDLRERLGLAPRTGFEHGNRILRVVVDGHDLGVVVDSVERIAMLDAALRHDQVLAAGERPDCHGPMWQIDGALVQELQLDAVLDADALAAFGWAQPGRQTDFDRLLEPTAAGSGTP